MKAEGNRNSQWGQVGVVLSDRVIRERLLRRGHLRNNVKKAEKDAVF